MIDDKDVWRAANMLIERFGKHSAAVARERAKGMLEEGDAGGQAVWKRIVRAIEEMQKERGDSPLH
jgi:hypothetical protein|tara:strand:+ start:177 stop:374 length:198 start_codon:yes stop_codon:yes gene_type:complete